MLEISIFGAGAGPIVARSDCQAATACVLSLLGSQKRDAADLAHGRGQPRDLTATRSTQSEFISSAEAGEAAGRV